MTMTARQAFERGTETFNSHDIDGFAEALADDVVFETPGGLRGQGKAPASNSTAAGSVPSPTRTSTCTAFTSPATSPSRRAHSQARTMACSKARWAKSHRQVARQNCLHPGAPFSGRQACLVQLDVRPAFDARAARSRSSTTTHGRVKHPRRAELAG